MEVLYGHCFDLICINITIPYRIPLESSQKHPLRYLQDIESLTRDHRQNVAL